jgi:metallo-beta-lactamase class B
MVMGSSSVMVVAAAVLAWGYPVPPAPALTDGIFGRYTGFDPSIAPERVDKEIIRRVIRSHIDEVKACYEKHLTAHPTLAGKIMVQFTVGPAGQVIASVLQHSTMGNDAVDACTVQAVRGWEFPKPVDGGIVIVAYPFILTPEPIEVVAGKDGAGRVELEGVNRSVVVHRSTDANGIPSNGLIVVTQRGLLLIDTAWSEAQTDAILNHGSMLFKRPWLGALITHDHNDRAGGVGALLRRRIPVAAMDLTVAKLNKRGVHGVLQLFAARDGEHVDPRGFVAFYPGPGHAPDNIVIKIDDIVFGGCLIKSTEARDLGFTGDADLAAWPAAVRRVIERYPEDGTTIIPGHGPIGGKIGGKISAYEHTLKLLQRGVAAR